MSELSLLYTRVLGARLLDRLELVLPGSPRTSACAPFTAPKTDFLDGFCGDVDGEAGLELSGVAFLEFGVLGESALG